MAANAIEVEGLSRSFGAETALDGLNLTVEHGGVFGLLGPNGAGKTTTVRILNGVLGATSATRLSVLGCSIPGELGELRSKVGVQTDTNLYERLTAQDNLALFARLYGMARATAASRARELLDQFGLAARAGDKVATFSKGMRQKLLIARALVADPELVYLDEPTAGLDPEASHDLMCYIRDVSAADGRTFFITSHRLEEMEAACTRIGVLDRGRLVADGSPEQVARTAIPEVRVRVRPAPGAAIAPEALRTIPHVDSVAADDGSILLHVTDSAAVPGVVRSVAALPVELFGVAEERPTLEEAYLRLVGSAHEAKGTS